ncbi:MAG: zf-HC2 domain-containing protein [Ruminococcaceae bacterium]|nr:zf-HC2 domain-containing protein [Oscillospiraceae bacterium]
MKYQCGIIRDLMPLYHDNVCSEESRGAVDEHLSECSECAEYYGNLSDSRTELVIPEREQQKAASFKAVSRRFRHGREIAVMLAVALAAVVFVGAIIITVAIMSRTMQTVKYEDENITVTKQQNGDLVCRLNDTGWNSYHIKNVHVNSGGDEKLYSFVRADVSVWGALIAKKGTFSEFTVAYGSGSGYEGACTADYIDRVYYYTGDMHGIETLPPEELAEVIENSVLLWEK